MKNLKKDKIAVICFGYKKKSLRSQPWFSVNKICKKLIKQNYDIFIISDGKKKFLHNFKVINLYKLFNLNSPTGELKRVINNIKPKKIIIVIGSQEFLFPMRFSSFNNVYFLLANNRFKINEILRITLTDFFKEFKLLFNPVFSSLIPGFLLKIGFYLTGSSNIIYLSKESQIRYKFNGLPGGKVFIPFKKKYFNRSKNFSQKKNKKILLTYFGPPLNLRGLDIVFDIFEKLSLIKPNLYLNLLIRNNKESYLKSNIVDLRNRIKNSKFQKKIILDTKYYSPTQFENKISKSSINILPFKITISDTPLVINDAIKTKVPLFVLNTPGITEHVKNTNSYVCKNKEDLYLTIKKFLTTR